MIWCLLDRLSGANLGSIWSFNFWSRLRFFCVSVWQFRIKSPFSGTALSLPLQLETTVRSLARSGGPLDWCSLRAAPRPRPSSVVAVCHAKWATVDSPSPEQVVRWWLVRYIVGWCLTVGCCRHVPSWQCRICKHGCLFLGKEKLLHSTATSTVLAEVHQRFGCTTRPEYVSLLITSSW